MVAAPFAERSASFGDELKSEFSDTIQNLHGTPQIMRSGSCGRALRCRTPSVYRRFHRFSYTHRSTMPVLWITVILSLLLALVFVALFVNEHGRFHFGSPERASLLPLAEETPRPAAGPAAPPQKPSSCDRSLSQNER
jgi:hypothetical protein